MFSNTMNAWCGSMWFKLLWLCVLSPPCLTRDSKTIIDHQLPFVPCGDHSAPIPNSVRIVQCARQKVCLLQPDQPYTLEVNFTSPKDAHKVYMKMFLLVGKKTLKLPLMANQDWCRIGNALQCPIKANQSYTYRWDFRIPKLTPDIVATLKLQLLTENKSRLFCFKSPLIIQK